MNIFPKELVGRYKNFKHFLISVREVIKNGYPARKLKVIGVTGTDGKTTTVHLIAEILKKAGYKTAFLSTLGAFADGEKLDTGLHTTTPDATVLQPLLKNWVQKGIQYAVLEVTSHGLDQHRVLGSNFLMGVLTNITHEHLDYHKTFENYRRIKAKLFRGVSVAVLNKDDPSFNYFKKLTKRGAKISSYSIKAPGTLTATQIHLSTQGMNFSVKEKGKRFGLETSLVGKYNVYNILAACSASRLLSVGWPTIKEAVKDFREVEGRMQGIPNKKGIKIIIDFAHTPASLEGLLSHLKAIKPRPAKLIAVFGCAGERDKLKRPIMGKISTRLADISIFTAEDPRSEDVNSIITDIASGAEEGKFYKEPDRKKAIKKALAMAKRGDIVAICGKGHEKTMAFGKKEIPWSDQETVKNILET